MNVAAAKTKLQYLFSKPSIAPEEAVRKILLYKIKKARGFIITIKPRDVETILGIHDHGLRTEVGKLLSKYAKEGLLKPAKRSRPRSYVVTSMFLREFFGLDYLSLRDRPSFAWLHIFYMVLSHIESKPLGEGV